jgi:glycine betaine/proline transport system substrate-binding protein
MVEKIFNFKFLFIFFIILLLIVIGFTDYLTEDNVEQKQETKSVNLVYVEWDSEVASSNVVKAVIEEKLGYICELLSVPLTALWEAVATGDQDVTVAAWLPSLQKEQQETYHDQVENLGPHIEITQMGLVVPDYVTIDSIKELKKHGEKFENKIIGIDPNAGIMGKTEKVMKEYNLADAFELITGSDSTMTTILRNAIREKRWIVLTGWTPHWKFAKWDLKYLEDPKNIYGKQEKIHTVVREGLKNDMPEVYKFLDNFQWETSDMEEVMLLIQKEENTSEEAAQIWIKKNENLVDNWISN